MKNIINTDDFRKKLGAWISVGDQSAPDFLYSNKQYIPQILRNYQGPLYRGMAVNEEALSIIDSGMFAFKKHTSWSKDQNIAKKFIDDPAYSIYNKSTDKKIKIMIKTNPSLSYQIFDIDSFVNIMGIDQLILLGYDDIDMNSAFKEKEVIIRKGFALRKTSYIKL